MKKYNVVLTDENRKKLMQMVTDETSNEAYAINASILLSCDDGPYQEDRKINREISTELGVSMRKIDRTKKRFVEDGIEAALHGRQSSREYRKTVDATVEKKLIELYNSDPPDGASQWSLRLLAKTASKLGYIESISHESVRRVLRKKIKR